MCPNAIKHQIVECGKRKGFPKGDLREVPKHFQHNSLEKRLTIGTRDKSSIARLRICRTLVSMKIIGANCSIEAATPTILSLLGNSHCLIEDGGVELGVWLTSSQSLIGHIGQYHPLGGYCNECWSLRWK